MTEQLNIPELRRLHAAATPGPWGGDWDITTEDGDPIARTDVSLASDHEQSANDGPLIIAMRNALPALLDAAEERDALKAAKDGAYRERDRLVALISKVFPAWLARHPDADTSWDNDWRWIVFVMLPTGQASWHIHDSELAWFDHLPREGAPEWDGHSTEEKYRRVESVATNHVADAGKMVAALKAKLAALAVAWDAYLHSEDEDRVAEWIALCEAFSAAKAAP